MNDKHHNDNQQGGKTFSRRTFLKALGLGTATAAAPAIVSCASGDGPKANAKEPPVGKMTYRVNPKTKEKVSILGYGMMRLPATNGKPFGRENDAEIDQEAADSMPYISDKASCVLLDEHDDIVAFGVSFPTTISPQSSQ